MSRLIETIRVSEGRAENLQYHLERMNDSSQAVFGDTLHWKPKDFIRDMEFPSTGVHKLRIVYDQTGKTSGLSPYTIRPVPSLTLVVDNDIAYDHKFENRTRLERFGDALFIKNDLVTDVSYANIIFMKDDRWYTPDSYLLNGTMRRYLLDNKKISERRITVGDIKSFTHFKLINAMLRDEGPASEISNIR